MKKIKVLLAISICIIVTSVLIQSCALQPLAWTPPAKPELNGPIAENELLSTTEWIDLFFADFENWYRTSKNPWTKIWLSGVGKTHLEEAEQTIREAEWDYLKFDPFKCHIGGSGGYCLLTQQIATWALGWSLEIKEKFPAPLEAFKPIFERQGPMTLSWIPMIGYDADTYAATAGPMIAAAFGGLPQSMLI